MFLRCLRFKRQTIKYVLVVFLIVVLVLYIRKLQLPVNEAIINERQFDSHVNQYERQLILYESKIVPNLGNNGESAYLVSAEERDAGEKALKKLALNTVLSDRMPLNRTLRDPRNTK